MSQQPRKKNHSRKFKVERLPQHLQHINVNAAGIDIGAEQHLVAVPEGHDEAAVREFGRFHCRFAGNRRLVGTLRCDHRGYGIDGRLLDSAVRVAGAARVRRKAGRRTARQECIRAQIGRA